MSKKYIIPRSLALGGGKMVDMVVDSYKTRDLMLCASMQRIMVFDAHHRYGNCERILAHFQPGVESVIMTKVSAYLGSEEMMWKSLAMSALTLPWIDILWVSDLDDIGLYVTGEWMYDILREKLGDLEYLDFGITTECPSLAIKFLADHPECRNIMVPLHPSNFEQMRPVFGYAKERGVRTFVIKPFDDGRALKTHSIEQCLQLSAEVEATVVVVGTKSGDHLNQVARIWRKLTLTEEVKD